MNQQQQIDEITQIDKITQMLELYLELGGDSYYVARKALNWAGELFCILDELARNDSAIRAKLQDILVKRAERAENVSKRNRKNDVF